VRAPAGEEVIVLTLPAQPDRKVVIAGWDGVDLLVARLLRDGSFDPGFGQGGVVRTALAGAAAWIRGSTRGWPARGGEGSMPPRRGDP